MAEEKTVSTEVVSTDKVAAKDKPAKKKKGNNIFKRIGKYFHNVFSEFKKISWPTFPSVVRNTVVTLTMCIVLGIVIVAFDAGLGALIKLLVGIGG